MHLIIFRSTALACRNNYKGFILNRMGNGMHLNNISERNFQNLLTVTNSIWRSIMCGCINIFGKFERLGWWNQILFVEYICLSFHERQSLKRWRLCFSRALQLVCRTIQQHQAILAWWKEDKRCTWHFALVTWCSAFWEWSKWFCVAIQSISWTCWSGMVTLAISNFWSAMWLKIK
jgi:hypothetical protein